MIYNENGRKFHSFSHFPPFPYFIPLRFNVFIHYQRIALSNKFIPSLPSIANSNHSFTSKPTNNQQPPNATSNNWHSTESQQWTTNVHHPRPSSGWALGPTGLWEQPWGSSEGALREPWGSALARGSWNLLKYLNFIKISLISLKLLNFIKISTFSLKSPNFIKFHNFY